MGFLEVIFKGAITQKSNKAEFVQIQTSRKMTEADPIEIEAKRKETELLNKIRSDIETSRHRRQKYKNSFSAVLKLTKEGVVQLEEKIYKNTSNDIHIINEDSTKDFYKQYATGVFVVSL